jgi:hypothetical protein
MRPDATTDDVKSMDLAVFALSLLDGAVHKVHTEDIAKKCFEIAPDRFRWEKYEFPDKELVRKALFHASEQRNGGLVTGRAGGDQRGKNRDGWQLTPAGAAWVRNAESILKGGAVATSGSVMPRKEADRLRRRLRAEQLFKTFKQQGNLAGISRYQFTDLLNCSPDASADTIKQKYDRLQSTAALLGDEDVLAFLDECQRNFGAVMIAGGSK